MRSLVIALGLIALFAGQVSQAFEIEVEKTFGPSDAKHSLRVISTTDIEIFTPVIEAYLATEPGIALHYIVASSKEIFAAIDADAEAFDLVLSSAMDLQMKLANDGYAAAYRSAATDTLPDWAHWRDRLFGYAQDPVVTLISRRDFADLAIPHTRRELLAVLRDHPDRFRGRIATYDPRVSGAGYLFITQDARQTDTFWRLAEVMGRLDARLYCCSSPMISDVDSGQMAVAYNVLGSYADALLTPDGNGMVVAFDDFTHTLLRTGFIPSNAVNPGDGGRFLDYLLGPAGQSLIRSAANLPPLRDPLITDLPNLRPIRLDPGLLVYLDQLKRANVLREWAGALNQN